MKAPSLMWECDYKHGRRAHRHRCNHCRRILNEGDRTLMLRLRKGSRAVHIECADAELPAGWTVRQTFEVWEREGQQALGFKVPDHPLLIAWRRAQHPAAALSL